MKIKLLVSRSGVDGAQNRGDEIEVSANEADRMIAAGQAELVRSSHAKNAAPVIERAVSKPSKETR